MRDILGDLQLQVMEIVWSRGNATVAEVHEQLNCRRPLAYTTALSTLRGLERRAFLRHTQEGKAHRFHASISREEYTRRRVSQLVEMISGLCSRSRSSSSAGGFSGARSRSMSPWGSMRTPAARAKSSTWAAVIRHRPTFSQVATVATATLGFRLGVECRRHP